MPNFFSTCLGPEEHCKHWRVLEHQEPACIEKADAEERSKQLENLPPQEERCPICRSPMPNIMKLHSFGISETCPTCLEASPPSPAKMFEMGMHRWLVLDGRFGQGDNKPWRTISTVADHRELDEVMRMLHEAADQNYTAARCCLGIMYEDGRGVSQCKSKALEWYRRAGE